MGAGIASRGLSLTYRPAEMTWSGVISLTPEQDGPFRYKYVMADKNGEALYEEGVQNRICRPRELPGCETILLHDYWSPPNDRSGIFETAPFREVIFKPRKREPHENAYQASREGIFMGLHVAAPCVPPGHALFLMGEPPFLGAWDSRKAVRMRPATYPFWKADLYVDSASIPFTYKYATGNDPENLTWEQGDNRSFSINPGEHVHAVIVTDWPFRYPGGSWKGAGIAVPVFSLRTDNGMGVGEFPDLKPMADWARLMGLQLIQILPVNDTSAYGTWYDSYPYSVISVFALHPIYLNLSGLVAPDSALGREIATQAKRLNKSATLDYEDVMATKTDLLKRIFQEDALRFLDTQPYRNFFREHAQWLQPYATFCRLRDRHGTSDHRQWGADSGGTPEAIARLTDPEAPHYPDVAFHYFIQFHLHRQLAEAAAYAREQGIILKGDIPIGVAKGSVETWLHPAWFHMDQSAGAPPDDFTEEGQNWGFPTYNWDAMAADGYSWWRRRLRHQSSFFDAVRLDHVIGFFRIWTIPDDSVTALRGRFYPAAPLTVEELEQQGIDDLDRLCEPYITDLILEQLFGSGAAELIRIFLVEKAPGIYRFKAPFSNQRDLSAHMDAGHGHWEDPAFQEQRHKLMRLHDEVLLIPENAGDRTRFHPRILMEKTFSFQALNEETRNVLRRLYQDYFFDRQEDLWQAAGFMKLTALTTATNMMICGEDLGMVPRCVPDVLEKLHILSLRIERMPVRLGDIFGDPAGYPYLSVASSGTHDMSTLRGWWEETDRAVVQFFYQNILGRGGIAPKTCDPGLCREIIERHLQSSSLWTIIPVQDLLGTDTLLRQADPGSERINDPATPHHNWNFRLHRTLEDLLGQKAFNARVQEIIHAART